MRKLENVLSDSMAQIEYYASKAQSDLMSVDLVEGEVNTFCYDFEPDMFKWVTEEAVCDYFNDYCYEEILAIEKEYGVAATIEIDGDGTLIIGFDLTDCI